MTGYEPIFTPKEEKIQIQRQKVASMLKEGATYQKIHDTTGAQRNTINLVKRLLENENAAG